MNIMKKMTKSTTIDTITKVLMAVALPSVLEAIVET
jgi:hypothetical protein